MSVTFGSDGTLYCNSIQRNWGVAPNLFRYGCGCGKTFDGQSMWGYAMMSGGNIPSNLDCLSGYQTGSIYATKCGFHWNTTPPSYLLCQPLVKIISGHKYYFSTWYKCSTSSSFVIRDGDTDKFYIPLTTDGNWHFGSICFQPSSDINAADCISFSKKQVVRSGANWVVWVSSGTFSFTRTILFDITDMFGTTISNYFSTNDWKVWCDNYLRENRTFVTANVEGTHYLKPSGIGGGTSGSTDYNKSTAELAASWDQEWYIAYQTGTSSEALLYFDNLSLTQNMYYYAQTYFMPNTSYAYQGKSYEWYWPEAEPNMGNQPLLVTQSKYGSAKDWRVVSDYARRTNWSSGNYKPRFDVNNSSTDLRVYTHAFGGIHPMGTSSSTGWFYYYNQFKSSSIGPTSTGVNRYFFDCWADGYSQPFIHCPSPLTADKQVKFNTSYDVTCNDLIIEPEINKIYFDEIGRIHCKALSPTVEAFV